MTENKEEVFKKFTEHFEWRESLDEIFGFAAFIDDATMLKFLLKEHWCSQHEFNGVGYTEFNLMKCATAADGEETFELLKDKMFKGCAKYNKDDSLCEIAAKLGRLEKLKWLHADGYKITFEAVDAAVEEKHIEVVTWMLSLPSDQLHIDGEEDWSIICTSAIKNIEMLKLLHSHGKIVDPRGLLQFADDNEWKEAAVWIRENVLTKKKKIKSKVSSVAREIQG